MDITFINLKNKKTYIIIGSNGLIGSSIVNSFHLRYKFNYKNFLVKQINNYYNLSSLIINNIKYLNRDNENKYSIIYCAGEGGFSLDIKSANRQIDYLKNFISSIYNSVNSEISFFLLSSLGCHSSQIDTPYKKLTLANEEKVLSNPNSHILRLPSIWGIKKFPLQPKGLIATLLMSLKESKKTRIFGDMNTLRNYISANQIGDNIFLLLINNQTLENEYNFFNNFNYTVFDLINIIKRLTKKKVFFEINRGNAAQTESFNLSPKNKNDIIVSEDINSAILKVWRNL